MLVFFLKENGAICLCCVQGEIEYAMSLDLGKGRGPFSFYWERALAYKMRQRLGREVDDTPPS